MTSAYPAAVARIGAPEPGQGGSHLLGSGATHSAITDTHFPPLSKSLRHRFPRRSEPCGGELTPECSGSHPGAGRDLQGADGEVSSRFGLTVGSDSERQLSLRNAGQSHAVEVM